MSEAKLLLWIFATGGAGACLRFLATGAIDVRTSTSFPHAGTLAVNLVGCLAIGLVAAALGPTPARVVVMAGLLGGFTTYSAFGLLAWELGREGRLAVALAQIALHLVGGIVCVALGLLFGRAIFGGARVP